MLAFCKQVVSGDTFRTDSDEVIRLAGSVPLELENVRNSEAQRTLEKLILEKWVTCELVGFSFGKLVANVWVAGESVNAAMQKLSFNR